MQNPYQKIFLQGDHFAKIFFELKQKYSPRLPNFRLDNEFQTRFQPYFRYFFSKI